MHHCAATTSEVVTRTRSDFGEVRLGVIWPSQPRWGAPQFLFKGEHKHTLTFEDVSWIKWLRKLINYKYCSPPQWTSCLIMFSCCFSPSWWVLWHLTLHAQHTNRFIASTRWWWMRWSTSPFNSEIISHLHCLTVPCILQGLVQKKRKDKHAW